MKTTELLNIKKRIKKQGFNPVVIEDKLYFYQKGRYVEIDDSLYQKINLVRNAFNASSFTKLYCKKNLL